MKIVGFIDYYLDEWHANNYPRIINELTEGEFQVKYAYGKIDSPIGGITNAEWDYIFKVGFWDRVKADEINNQSIANLIVDWCWTSGIWGIKFTQRVLGVKDDGIVGKKTLSAINNYPNQKELFEKLWNRRKKHFEDLAKTHNRAKFLNGWLNRLSAFKYSE